MSYIVKSIPKKADGCGAPIAKQAMVTIIPVDVITAEPTRELGDPNLTGDYTLSADGKAINVYGTQKTIEVLSAMEGEVDGKGFKNGVKFDHPGDTAAIRGFVEKYANKGVVAIVTECDGAGKKQTVCGRVCNPLFLTVEPTLNGEATKRTLTFQQEQVDMFGPAYYSGKEVTVAENETYTNESA